MPSKQHLSTHRTASATRGFVDKHSLDSTQTLLFFCFPHTAALTVPCPCGIKCESVPVDVKFPHSRSPFSVSEITVPAPSPYWTAAAPCPDSETKTAHGPTETVTKIKTMLFDRIWNDETFINERVLPAAQSCLFLFLFAAPFPHKDAGSRYRVLLLFCKHFMKRIQIFISL